MPAARHRLIHLRVLAHADPAMLARLFAPWGPFFAAQEAPLDALAASKRGDRLVARRFAAAIHDARAPNEVRALAEALDVLADRRAARELVRLDVDQRLPRAALGDASLALSALLDAPDLARRALVIARALRAARDPARAYTDCLPSDDRALAYSPDCHDALERAHAVRFQARDASAFTTILVTETEEAWIFEIAHGDRPRTREIVDTAALALALVTDVSAHRAYAVLDKATRWLSVAAHAPVVKDLVRAAFGEVLAGSDEYFRAGDVYDLSPFAQPRAALSKAGVEGLERVSLHGVTVAVPKDITVDIDRDGDDLLDAGIDAFVHDALALGKLVGVRLYVRLETRGDASKVDLTAKAGRNVLVIDREDTELAAVVRAYFLARGVLRRPAQAAQEEAPPGSDDLRAE